MKLYEAPRANARGFLTLNLGLIYLIRGKIAVEQGFTLWKERLLI